MVQNWERFLESTIISKRKRTKWNVKLRVNNTTNNTDTDAINNLNNTNLLTEISIIKEKIGNLTLDISNNTITKFYELRKTYTEDIRCILENHELNNKEKLFEKIEKENTNIIDKTGLIISELIPKTHQIYYNQYDNIIRSFKEEMLKEISKINIS